MKAIIYNQNKVAISIARYILFGSNDSVIELRKYVASLPPVSAIFLLELIGSNAGTDSGPRGPRGQVVTSVRELWKPETTRTVVSRGRYGACPGSHRSGHKVIPHGRNRTAAVAADEPRAIGRTVSLTVYNAAAAEGVLRARIFIGSHPVERRTRRWRLWQR